MKFIKNPTRKTRRRKTTTNRTVRLNQELIVFNYLTIINKCNQLYLSNPLVILCIKAIVYKHIQYLYLYLWKSDTTPQLNSSQTNGFSCTVSIPVYVFYVTICILRRSIHLHIPTIDYLDYISYIDYICGIA